MIEIDPGRYRTKHGDITWYWLEATVFEDMCALVNLAKQHTGKLGEIYLENKRPYKTGMSLNRTTVIVAFHFVEAYLNGLAFDYWIRNRMSVDKKTTSLLLDWDIENDRPQYLSLRDKALKYPRIILAAQHSPIQESNCPELKYVLERAKQIRDAITPVSPKREFEFSSSANSMPFYGINFGEVEKAVDSAIKVVRKLEKAIFGHNNRLFWLESRSSDGFFSDKVFQ